MRRFRRIVLLLTVLGALAGAGVAAAPAEARGPGGACRLVPPRIDENGRITVIECYY